MCVSLSLSELWDVGILRFVIVFGMFFVAVLAFIAGRDLNRSFDNCLTCPGVLNAVAAGQFNGFSQLAAASAFGFLLMIASALCGIFSWMAGGGGTSSA